eukprot:SAG31_NODE_4467_length_3208_cov_4.779994_2_plen_100_part_00
MDQFYLKKNNLLSNFIKIKIKIKITKIDLLLPVRVVLRKKSSCFLKMVHFRSKFRYMIKDTVLPLNKKTYSTVHATLLKDQGVDIKIVNILLVQLYHII